MIFKKKYNYVTICNYFCYFCVLSKLHSKKLIISLRLLTKSYCSKIAFRILGLLLISILIFDMTIPNVSFHINKKRIQKEMKRYLRRDIKTEDIEILEISKSEISNKKLFHWVHSMEFRYRGAMYDLIPGKETVETENSYIFTVVNDVKEEQFLSSFMMSCSNAPIKNMLNTIKQFAYDAVKKIIQENTFLYENKIIYFNYSQKVLLIFSKIDTPPPEKIYSN